MFRGYASNHEGDCYKMQNPKTKMVSKTCDVVFLNRMFFKAPENTKKLQKKQDPDDTELGSVQQDERGGTVTIDFDANDKAASAEDSMGPSVKWYCKQSTSLQLGVY
jgi:hypothetical protein